MSHPTDHLVRAHRGLTLRAADEGDSDHLAKLDITFARFNIWNEIDSWYEGRFLERVAPGAFTKTFQERRDNIVSLFNHGHDPQIGDKVLGPVSEVGERDGGPFMLVELMDTSYGRDLLPGLQRGLYGASYMFRVIGEDWNDEPGTSDHNPLGLPERTIREVKLYEAGPVTFPADEGTTIGLRSLTDRFNSQALQARGAATGTPRGEAANTTSDEPAESHSQRTTLTIDQARTALRLAS